MVPKELVAATSGMMVLSVLSHGESYGYAIGKHIRRATAGSMDWADGMLYPVLHRLEASGFVRAEWRTPDGGRRRRYYAITSRGREELMRMRDQWDAVDRTLRILLEKADTGERDV
jgi:DNA-binding PadR family transcriptional regulator